MRTFKSATSRSPASSSGTAPGANPPICSRRITRSRQHHLAALEPEVFDPATGLMVITYQTFVVRTPHHTILVDTCTGEDKGYPAPMDFPKQRCLDDSRRPA